MSRRQQDRNMLQRPILDEVVSNNTYNRGANRIDQKIQPYHESLYP